MLTRIFGFLLTLMSVYGVTMGSNLPQLYHPKVWTFVFGLAVAGYLIAAGPALRRSLSALIRQDAPDQDLASAIHALQYARWGALTGGFISTISGITLVLADFDDPSTVSISLVLVLLGLLVGLGLSQILLLPVQARLELRRSLRSGVDMGSDGVTGDLLLFGACFLFTSVTFVIATASI